MSDSDHLELSPDGPLAKDLEIDALCEKFETALRAGEEPRVADYLASAPEDIRTTLQIELDKVLQAHQTTQARAGARVGAYTLVSKIGEGGMGEVWTARQEEPIRRDVAIKFIKAGMDSKAVLARFDQERQALALLDHPNIARVLDGGLTPERRPYFIMELVKGQPLLQFCDDARLSIPERLKLFVTICHAVQHAHNKGIVHRDLKPSNILVADVDGKPMVKVIDFGLAKAVGGGLTEASVATQLGAIVGTLEYMAPEQAGGSATDIDTRADLYSLGVILYELLTGLRPLDAGRRKELSLEQLIRMYREEEPPRPSARVSSDTLPSHATSRRTEPKSLATLLRGDLDWIVMKCLEKDRSRRYETASGLGRDIERYLASEPVEARPPSARYKLQKFVRRNRALVTAGSVVLMTLVLGVMAATWGFIEAKRSEAKAISESNDKELALREEEKQRKEATKQKTQADQARDQLRIALEEEEKLRKEAFTQKTEAEQARNDLRRRLDQIEKGNEIILSLFEDLDVRKIRDEKIPLEAAVATRLVKAGALIEGDSLGNSLDVAQLQFRLGKTLLALGHTKDALALFEKCHATRTVLLGADDPLTLATISYVASSHQVLGNMTAALPLFEETLERRKTSLGPKHPDTLTSMAKLASAYQNLRKMELALPLFEEAFELRKTVSGPEHLDTLAAMSGLAGAYRMTGRRDDSIRLYKEAIALSKAKLGADHPTTLGRMNALAVTYASYGREKDAVPLYEETVRVMKIKLGADHPSTQTVMQNLATCYEKMGKGHLATLLLESKMNELKSSLGHEHPTTLDAMKELAELYRKKSKLDLAVPLNHEILKAKKVRLGTNHPEVLAETLRLAADYRTLNQLDQAIALCEESLKVNQTKLASDNPGRLDITSLLASYYSFQNKFDLAIPMLEDTLKIRLTKLGRDHDDTLKAMGSLASVYVSAKKYEQGLPLHVELLERHKIKHGATHHTTVTRTKYVAGLHATAGKLDVAIRLYEEALTIMKAKPVGSALEIAAKEKIYEGKKIVDISLALASGTQILVTSRELAKVYARTNQLDKEEAMLRASMADLRQKWPMRDYHLQAQYLLADCLLRAKKYVEAEANLKQCLPVLEKQEFNYWGTYAKRVKLGIAQLHQMKYAEAEPNLLKGYEGMKAHEKSMTPAERLREFPVVCNSFIALYKALDRPDEAQKWQAERAKFAPKKKAPVKLTK